MWWEIFEERTLDGAIVIHNGSDYVCRGALSLVHALYRLYLWVWVFVFARNCIKLFVGFVHPILVNDFVFVYRFTNANANSVEVHIDLKKKISLLHKLKCKHWTNR